MTMNSIPIPYTKGYLLALTVVLTGLTISSTEAVTIHWVSAAEDFVYESDGTLASSGDFNFELGTFADGFVPTDTNLASWQANWHLLDIGTYSSVTGRFAGTVSLLDTPAPDGSILNGDASDPASFFFGKDAFIWVYNQNTTIDGTLEWNLLTNPNGDGSDPATAWSFPTAIDSGPHTAVHEFALSDLGVIANFGEETGGGTITTGGGEFTSAPTGTYGLQTFTIPEPSSSLLALLGLLALITQRRRTIS